MTHNAADTNTGNLSLGMMSVFAFFSIFQVEKMLRGILGVGESRAAPGSAMKSIAKTAVAFTLGKRLLDNATKVGSGVKGISDSRKANKKTKDRYDEDVANLGLNKGGKPGTGGSTKTSTSGTTKTGTANSAGNAQGSGADEEEFGNGVLESGSSKADLKMKRAYTAIQRKYEDEIKANKKQRDESIKSLSKGLTESAGAIIGAPAGLILGGADGNIDDALRGAVSGAGVGDVVGEKIIDAGFAIKNIGKASKEIIDRNSKMSNKHLKSYIDARNKEIEEALRNIDSNIDNM